jgi:hypothetical protein
MTLRGRSQVTVVGDEKCRRNSQTRTGAGKGREELQSRNRGRVTGAIRRLAPAPLLSALVLSGLLYGKCIVSHIVRCIFYELS